MTVRSMDTGWMDWQPPQKAPAVLEYRHFEELLIADRKASLRGGERY